MSRANEENNDLDDLFTKPDDSDGGDDFFASLSGSQDADASPFGGFDGDTPSEASPSPFDSADSASDESFGGFADEFSESESVEALPGEPFEPFGNEAGLVPPSDAPAGKKGQKAKKVKAPKTPKAPKAPKAKKAKEPKSDVSFGSAKPFLLLGAIFLLGLLAANGVAFAKYGGGAIAFLACFDALGLILLAIPALLIRQLRTRAVGLFDVFIALAAAFLAIAAMTLLAYQAKTYGSSSKVASTVAASTFVDRA